MWYMFPQLRGLGTSTMAYRYGISGLDEAKAYLEHPLLSGRLYELCGELLKRKDKTALEIFGDIDEMKLKSSMTLFALTTEDYTIFDEVLERFFYGQMDESTVKLINKWIIPALQGAGFLFAKLYRVIIFCALLLLI